MTRRSDAGAPAPKRIVYVEGNVDGTIGGSYISLYLLASRVHRNRFQPVVVFATDNELIPRFTACGIEVLIRRPPEPVRWGGGIGRILGKAVNFLRGGVLEPIGLAALLRRRRAALLHLNNSITRNESWIVAAILARVPCITHERGINDHFTPRARRLARSLRAIVCISAAVRDNMIAHGLEHLPLLTIHNGLDLASMRVTRPPSAIRRELGLAEDARLVGMVGNIRSWKGQEVAVRAMARLRGAYPSLVCLLIGGTASADRDYDVALRKLIRELSLEEAVRFTGYREDVANYVNALEVQIHASVEPEPFGRVLLEAMALSKPLVASRSGAVPEIVVDGVTGLLFEPGDADSLASRLATLLADPARAAEMGRNARMRVEENFSVDRTTRDVEALYERLGL